MRGEEEKTAGAAPCQRVIETERLVLRPMREEDAERVVSWRNQAGDETAFLAGTRLTLEEHLRWFRGPRADRVDYVIVRREDGGLIGTLHFKNIDLAAGTAESGRLIGDRRERGKGYGWEAAVAWLSFGFLELGLRRVIGVTHEANTANLELNRKLGYALEGSGAKDGLPEHYVRLVLTREAAARAGWLKTGDAPLQGRDFSV